MAGTTNTTNREERRRSATTHVRLVLVAGSALLAALAVVAASACLPDLAAITTEDASSALESGPVTRFHGCGDGVIATLDDGGDSGESCDPGADAQPGCTADCRIECAGALDPATGHCYFVAGSDSTYEFAKNHCKLARAHLVTFASNEEVTFVDTRVAADGGTAASYWVGLLKSGETSGAYGSSEPDQPGFPTPARGPCSGCFGIGADDAGVFAQDTDADAGATDCVAARNGTWVQVPCTTTTTTRTTICEREPVGTRAVDCFGGFCFTLPRTAGTKRYLVGVAATDPQTAAESCTVLGDGGSLVSFGSREEREQLAHELTVRYPDTPQELWIGLVEDAGAWVWDDGVVAVDDASASRPPPWGNAQPVTVSGARAYMRLTEAYDTQLAYSDDGGKPPRLYICQRPATE